MVGGVKGGALERSQRGAQQSGWQHLDEQSKGESKGRGLERLAPDRTNIEAHDGWIKSGLKPLKREGGKGHNDWGKDNGQHAKMTLALRPRKRRRKRCHEGETT